ncbi:PTS fructose transporter subunit IIA [Jannaschia sp. Os4]|uniref:PTS sugar transporter subunit IIA n=1 Tax=Jannaschia sp. Os4 TaxID=2807617 RepID=UPI00193A7DC6|nr:PTS fructose transporter subunit IIA [Jannaschia sp. Os4]MBM2577184.1 PTS fructose transporter subunit IIA [Jannaschia sp. Os4]
MIGIVIVAHGGLAEEYRRAVEHVIGPQDGVRAISVGASCDRAAKEREICGAADAVDQGDGVVVVTDIFGGSPSNLSLPACAARDRVIFFGANLPALIKLARSRAKPVAEAVALAKAAGTRYMDVAQGPAPAA